MAEPAFSREVEKALNAYTVPPVPQGFGDRLMARVASGDTGAVDAAAHLPAPRLRKASPWRRTSRIVGSVAAISLMTATAAAAGIFGDPVYVPGVSEALVEAKIVEAPAPVVKPKVKMVAEARAAAETTAAGATAPVTGSAAIVNRVTDLRNDAEFARLTPRQRMAVAGKEVRQMIRSGEASRADVRTAVRELAQNADPATKEAWRKAAVERRERRLERRAALNAQPVPEIEPASADPLTVTTEAEPVAPETLPAIETASIAPERLEALRERYRTATPEQRAAIRAGLRERRQVRRERRTQ
jgi:hypothetical protein